MPDRLVLIAEDERTARTALAGLLAAEGYEVLSVDDGDQALQLTAERRPEVALFDIRMPKLDGLTLLRRLRDRNIDTSVIVMTAYGTSDTAIEAMKQGAFDYITKPIDAGELLLLVQRAFEQRALRREVESLRERTPGAIVGQSPAMQRIYKLIGQVAGSDATVLVRGESGTGKELVVNAIHEHSARGRGPLVKINCAAIPEALLESELFGHEKGAFTNALLRRIGRFEEASGGTLFLDEIGDLPPSLQVKLLRALQERTIERLGSNKPIRVDIRLVAATAKNLEGEVAAGRFREDLYYRLNVVNLELPPLRERTQDIPALVQHFLGRATSPGSITSEALEVLCTYDWPGNVRQLENVIERARVLAHGGIITADRIHLGSLPSAPRATEPETSSPQDGLESAVERLERSLIDKALREAGGNKTRAAEILKIHRRLLYEKMRRYEIH
ncbi:MAG: sigma-54-dependent Fis family transcriptional regulator [Acidobacteria bacterium]|nr:sigma-54-dependent Fis family transcriptional regulator [Acidobacteriota bacterium]